MSLGKLELEKNRFKLVASRVGKQVENGFMMEFIHLEPDPDLFRSYLMVLRLFVSDRERTYFNTVSNLIKNGQYSNLLKEVTKEIRTAFARVVKEPGIPFIMNEQRVAPDSVGHLFFNSLYFHRDEDKLAALESLQDSPATAVLKFNFLHSRIHFFRPIQNLSIVLRNRTDDNILDSFLSELKRSEQA